LIVVKFVLNKEIRRKDKLLKKEREKEKE